MNDPARLPLIDDPAEDARVRAVFERSRAGFGEVPNLYRTLGHAPELLDAWVAFAWPLRNEATTSRLLRELVILRVAELDGADYERAHHVPMAVAAGATTAQLDHLERWRQAPAGTYHADILAGLAVADRVNAGEPIADDEWVALHSALGDRGALEVVLTASFYACVSRVLIALGVPLEDES